MNANFEKFLAAARKLQYDEGYAKGLALGEAKGLALGEAKGILLVLETRGVAMTEEQRARILACSDHETIEAWLRKAAVASSADELF